MRLLPRVARHVVVIACAFFLVSHAARADETGRPLIQRFSAKEYGAHYQVWCAVQSPDGMMWFGSAGCVVTFDGRTWGQVTVPTSFVRQLALGADGAIYAAGEDELGFIRREADGSAKYHSLKNQIPADALPFGLARRIEVQGDAVFFSADRHVFRWQGGRMRMWSFPPERRNIVDVIGGEVFLLRGSDGIFRLRDDEFRPWTAPEAMQGPQFLFLLPPPRGSNAIALLSTKSGLLLVDADGGATPWNHAARDALSGKAVYSGRRLADGSYALGTISGGLFLIAADGASFRHYGPEDGLSNETVIGVQEDREGGLWACTQNGISRLDRASHATLFDSANGLGDGILTALLRHHDGVLYAVFNQQLLRLVPGATPGAARWERDPRVPADVPISTAISHRDGLLLGAGRGISILRGDQLVPLQNAAHQPTSFLVSTSDPERVFVGFDLHVATLAHRDGEWKDEGRIPGAEGEPFSMIERDGALWVATSTRGVFRIERPANGRWQDARVRTFFESDGLPRGHGWIFVRETTYGAHFSTEKGCFTFDASSGAFVPERRFAPDGRTDLCVESITPGAPGETWFTASATRATAEYPLVRARQGADGRIACEPAPATLRALLGVSGAQNMLHETTPAGGVLWVKGMDCLLRIETADLAPRRVAWTPLLHEFRADNATQPLRGDAPTRFAYNRDPYVFRFSSALFRTGAQPEFQTRLVGFRDAWSPFSRDTETTFTNLEGGPFTFEVRGRDADGNLSEVARVTFSVTPPWHRRPLAYTLYGVLGLGAVAGYVRWRLHSVRRERDRLERTVAERTTELREAKQRADHANEAKSTFLAHMSHELRTPLNGVIGYAQILRRSPRLAPEDRARVEIVNASGEHLLRMINEVLDFAKIEAGKLELRTAPFSLASLVQDLATGLELRAHEKQLTFETVARGLDTRLVLGDAQKLRQVLENLLGNAIKFTATGRVTLRVERVDNCRAEFEDPALQSVVDLWRFTVTDTGVGIAPADLARLFEPFQQARENRPNVPGTGLGLAIARRLVELMGGALEVESTPGHGSRFSFTAPLPRLEIRADAGAAAPIVGYAGPRRRLLVIDDVATNRQLIVDLLTPLGFDVTQAATGRDGVRVALETRPHLVFLDLRLPDISGLEVARQLRAVETTRHAALLAMSASVLSFNRDDAFAAGCDGFLPKPYREDDLFKAIAAALGLTWTHADGATPPPAAASATELPAELVRELATLAETGDIAALREALAAARRTHPDHATLAAIDTAAAAYQLERVRQLLAEALRT